MSVASAGLRHRPFQGCRGLGLFSLKDPDPVAQDVIDLRRTILDQRVEPREALSCGFRLPAQGLDSARHLGTSHGLPLDQSFEHGPEAFGRQQPCLERPENEAVEHVRGDVPTRARGGAFLVVGSAAVVAVAPTPPNGAGTRHPGSAGRVNEHARQKRGPVRDTRRSLTRIALLELGLHGVENVPADHRWNRNVGDRLGFVGVPRLAYRRAVWIAAGDIIIRRQDLVDRSDAEQGTSASAQPSSVQDLNLFYSSA